MVQPGGTREGSRSSRIRYKVDWGKRTGYLKLALKHGLPIVPAAASGVDDTYIGLNNGLKLAKKINAVLTPAQQREFAVLVEQFDRRARRFRSEVPPGGRPDRPVGSRAAAGRA